MIGSNLWSWQTRAVRGEPEEDPGGCLDPVARIVGQVFLDDGAAFVGRDIAALEAGGDDLFERRFWQEVAGELLGDEIVEPLVSVEGIDDPVAVRPHFAVVVEMHSVGIAVARRIEPVARAMFAVAR